MNENNYEEENVNVDVITKLNNSTRIEDVIVDVLTPHPLSSKIYEHRKSKMQIKPLAETMRR